MKYILILTAALFLVTTSARAQSAGATTASAAPVTASHRQAAEQLLTIMQLEQTTNAALDQMLSAQIAQNPELKSVEREMRAFMSKYLSWDALKNDMVAIYTREFTESELKELCQFYASPIGQKLVGKQSQLLAAGMELGQRRVKEHLPELQKSIRNKRENAHE